ncbi:uncharacterized protein [Narcine bancroftii]|uniref:uncharacterized protein n=1 Tax=Narcine bancroftii TaxID=1343680 RepID=UPI0038321493
MSGTSFETRCYTTSSLTSHTTSADSCLNAIEQNCRQRLATSQNSAAGEEREAFDKQKQVLGPTPLSTKPNVSSRAFQLCAREKLTTCCLPWILPDPLSHILLALLVAAFLFPQLFVLVWPRSSRYCDQPLLHSLTTFIIFTFLMTGFTFLLTLMDPIPCTLKVAFHAFGVGSFLQGILTTAFTVAAPQCVNTIPELYYLSFVLSALSVLATVFIILLLPFWLINVLYPGLLLSPGPPAAICHQPVADCSCLWYI